MLNTNFTCYIWENFKARENLKDIDVNGKIILKAVLSISKYAEVVEWFELVQRPMTSCSECSNEPLCSVKGYFLLCKQLSSS
jgi:hypothetical protein